MSTVVSNNEATPQPRLPAATADELADRRADVEEKQTWVAGLLQETRCDGLLALEPENFAWLTAGGTPRGVVDPREMPAVYYTAEGRWILSGNMDSQRIFDEEVDGLGFQLKEWPWHLGRETLLADLCNGRAVASDRPLTICKTAVAEQLRQRRRRLSAYEQECAKALGSLVGHALGATCRTMNPGETEREIAGQVSHRLLHRGAFPVSITVLGDGRSHLYRQAGFTALTVDQYCVVSATVRKFGLCATAARTVCFGKPDPMLQKEHDVATRVSATYLASSWPDAIASEILNLGARVYEMGGMEHEWRTGPQGYVTGRHPVELAFRPARQDLLQEGWGLVWQATAGAAQSIDTFLVTDAGPQLATPADAWPLKKIRIQGNEFHRPDILAR